MLIAQGAGMDYRTLIGEIMSGAIRRYKEREARRAAGTETAQLAVNGNGNGNGANGHAVGVEPVAELREGKG